MSRHNRYRLKSNAYRQKSLSNTMINVIRKHQRQLQEQENKLHGHKAQTVTFVYASKSLSKIMGGNK